MFGLGLDSNTDGGESGDGDRELECAVKSWFVWELGVDCTGVR